MNNEWDYTEDGGLILNGIEHCAHCAKMPDRDCCEDHDNPEYKDHQVTTFDCTCNKCNYCSKWYRKTFGSKETESTQTE